MKAYLVDLYKRQESGMFERIRREYLNNEKAGVREIELHIEYGVDGAGVMQEVNVDESEMNLDNPPVLAVDTSCIFIPNLKTYYKKTPVLFSVAKINGLRRNNYIDKSKMYVLDVAPY